MPEESRELKRIFGRRICVSAAVASVAGAGIYLLLFPGDGWWWDGFWLALLGMLLGQSAGFAAEVRCPAWRR